MKAHVSRFRSLPRWTLWRLVLGATALPTLSTLFSCTSHPLAAPDPMPATETDTLFDINQGRKLDLVFLIDNSSSMTPKQNLLSRNFPAFIDELEKIPGGLPDVRIAVVSSSFGAGPNQPAANCPPYGDRGRFLVKPGCGLDQNAFHWLEADGMTQTKNFTGNLADVFSCMALVGDQGCGYEHQLQALRAALYDVNPENRGFLRDEAYLGIVILSDEDDCSAEPYATFFDAPVPDGQATSLTCSLVGHEYQAQPGVWQDVPAQDGFSTPLANVRPYQRKQDPQFDSHPQDEPIRRTRLINVSELAEFIQAKKPNRPERLLVSAIIGWPDDAKDAVYAIGKVMKAEPPRTELDNVPICHNPGNAGIYATPGIRFKAFMDSFGDNGHIYTICQDDFTQAVRDIGHNLAKRLTNTCIEARLVDTDVNAPGLQAECQVTDRTPQGTDYADTPLPACDTGMSPCWQLAPDAMCGSGYHVDRIPLDRPAPAGTLLGVKCLTCTSAATGKVDPRCTTP
jgi:hypothetical protein